MMANRAYRTEFSAMSQTTAPPKIYPADERPNETGHYGPFGGRYVPETLMQTLLDLEKE